MYVSRQESILDYCSFILNPTLCYNIDSVENVQKANTRRVFRKCMKPYAKYENWLAHLNRKTNETSKCIMSLAMFYNIYHKLVAFNIPDSFTALAHNIEIYFVIIIGFLYHIVKQIIENFFRILLF